MAGAFYRILFRNFGSSVFWLFSTLAFAIASFISLEFSIIVAGMLLTVGLYTELENRGKGAFVTATLSVIFISSLVAVSLWQILALQGLNFSSGIEAVVNFLLAQQGQKIPEGFSSEKIGPLVPSILVVFNGLILGFGLMLDRSVARLFNLKFLNVASQIRLQNIATPEFLIWPLILGFALSFSPVEQNITNIGLNVFIVSAFCFWFQGLAVIEFLIKAFNVGPFMKILFYFLVVLQMPFILSGIGIIDYWLDIRKRFKRSKIKTTTQNEEKL